MVYSLNRLRRWPQIKDDPRNEDNLENVDNLNEDDLKNKDNLKNEDDLKTKGHHRNKDDLKIEDNLILKTFRCHSLLNLSCTCFNFDVVFIFGIFYIYSLPEHHYYYLEKIWCMMQISWCMMHDDSSFSGANRNKTTKCER